MIAVVWSWLTSKIAGPVFGVASVVLLAWGVTERVQLAGARLHAKQLAAQVASAKADLSTCSANLRTEMEAEAVQETAVQALKAEAVAKAAALDKAAHDALSARAVAESRAQSIMALKPGQDRCASAEGLLRKAD